MLKITRKQPEVEQLENEESKEGIMMKVGAWSLKKKILVGAGAVGAAVLGVLAYGQCTKTDEVEYDGMNQENDEGDEIVYDEEAELAEMEQMENEELNKENQE